MQWALPQGPHLLGLHRWPYAVLVCLAASASTDGMPWLQILDTAPPTYPLPTRAVFQYAPSRDIAVGQDICLQAGVLELSTVSVYINGTFTW